MDKLLQRAKALADLREQATEGPWYAIPHPEFPGSNHRIDNRPDAPWANFAQICYTSPRNAPLIAAAPEMAETLDRLAGELEQFLRWARSYCAEHCAEFIPYGKHAPNCPCDDLQIHPYYLTDIPLPAQAGGSQRS